MSIDAIPGSAASLAAGAPRIHRGVDRAALPAVLVLLAAAFLPTIVELVEYWADHPEYSHGFLMPPIAAWLFWRSRGEWSRVARGPSLVGALLLVPCLALLILGEMKLSWFLKPYAFVGCLAAVAWGFFGRRVGWVTLPAWFALVLMCPLPDRVKEAVTVPLKHSAAVFATGLLDLSNVPTALEGNLIHLQEIEDLWIADACSGLRSLIALVSLTVLACFLWRRPWPLRAIVLLSAVPIAILVNGLRIYGTGMLAVHAGPEAATGFFHFFEGFALFGAAALILWGWASLLARAFFRGPS